MRVCDRIHSRCARSSDPEYFSLLRNPQRPSLPARVPGKLSGGVMEDREPLELIGATEILFISTHLGRATGRMDVSWETH